VRLQHVGITVPADGLDRAREFYGGTLGLGELDAAQRRLEEAGYETLPSRPIDERRRFFVRDPFGNFIELLSASR
jgi:catechol 2,3-dioxygenase-like lactoylglutathione lyase family enzyme